MFVKDEHERQFAYEVDTYTCPRGGVLRYTTTDRNGNTEGMCKLPLQSISEREIMILHIGGVKNGANLHC